MEDTREPLRNYPVPDPANKVNDEFPRLSIAITMIASDMAGAYTAIAGKAPSVHTHTIDQISGLQGILDSKLNAGSTFALGTLSDVNATGAANFMALAYINGTWQPWVVNAVNINGLAAVIAGTAIDAGKITSGTLDPARIPVLQAFTTTISSGDLTALTTAQQAQIVQGSHVTTTDGWRWIYTGTGSKTLAASYIQLGDVTPDWSVIANKPATYSAWLSAMSAPGWLSSFDGSFATLTGGAGDLVMTRSNTAPVGTLKANGAAVLRTAYTALDAAIYVGDSANATAIDGFRCTDPANPTTTRSTTGAYLVLPDWRGNFFRGLDDGRGVDASRVLGSFQAADAGTHQHETSFGFDDTAGYGWSAAVNSPTYGSRVFTGRLTQFSAAVVTVGTLRVAWTSGPLAPGTIAHGDVRPRNTALLACIRY